MSGARLAHPEWLVPALATLGAAAILVVASWSTARRRAQRLLGDPGLGSRRALGRDLLLLTALALIALALLGPLVGRRSELVRSGGVDVVLLLDVSRSMQARDVPPSRSARAQRAADQVLAGLAPGDRAALAAFAGRGVLLTPLTPDHAALREMLPAFDAELMQQEGSRLAPGVRAALGAFEAGSRRPRTLVVLSDGEDPERTRELGSRAAARAGVRVVALALGTESGASVPDGRVPLLDAEGRPVVSRRDAARLHRLAEATGGELFVADRWGRLEMEAVLAEIRRDAPLAPGEPVLRSTPAVRVLPFAAAAIALLCLELVGLPAAGRRRGSAVALPVLAAGLLALSPGAAGEPRGASAQPRPARAPELLRAGVRRARAGDGVGAARALAAAAVTARDAAVAAHAYYNLGVVALETDQLAQARDAFLDALALAPDDFEARFNLEWTLAVLAQRREPAPVAPPPGAASERQQAPPRADAAPERRAASAPAELPEAPGAGTEVGRAARPPALSPDEVARWLDAVPDDPSASLRRAARGTPDRARSAGPRW